MATLIPKPIPKPGRLRPSLHLCVDVRERAIHWALSRAKAGGMQLVDWGTLVRDRSRSLEDELRDAFGDLDHRIEIGLRSTQLIHERTVLASIAPGEARQVAERRSADLAASIPGEACVAYTMRKHDDSTGLWLVGAPESESANAHRVWSEAGIVPWRLQSRHLALGQLVHFKADIGDGELIAIFDLESESGTCVLADRFGWIFSREVPLRFLGLCNQSGLPPQQYRADAIEIADDDDELLDTPASSHAAPADAPPAVEAAGPIGAPDEPQQAATAQQAELLATELRRTFRYVQGHLQSGPVSRVWLTGEVDAIEELAPALALELEMPVELLASEGAEPGEVASAAAAIGMAHAAERRLGNLLPLEVRQAVRSRTTRRRLMVGLAAVIAVVAGVGALLGIQYGTLRARAERTEQQWSQAQLERAEMKKTRLARGRAHAIEQAFERMNGQMPSWTQLLQTLGHTIPDEAAVHRLSGARAGAGWDLALSVEASGSTMAHAAQSISDFAQRVEVAPFAAVDEIEREATSSADTRNDAAAANRVRFRLEGRLAPVEPIRAPRQEDRSDA